MNDKCWFCLQEVEKDKWREHMDVVHRAVNREMPVEDNSILIEPPVMQKIEEQLRNALDLILKHCEIHRVSDGGALFVIENRGWKNGKCAEEM